MNELKMILKDTRKHLMTGVSYMIPFVVAGGILLALAVVFYGKGAVPDSGWKKDLFFIGVQGFTLMIPILAGFIAFSIADRPAIAPAMIAALVGNNMGAGFFGALITGLIGGIVVYYLKKIKVPPTFRSIMPIFVIPIVGTIITAGLMQWVIGAPIAAMQTALTGWLKGLSSGSIVFLAIMMGLMDAFDMGGPVNKVSYAFTILCVSQGLYHIAAINAVGVCIAPIGNGIATLIAPKKYTAAEREAGKAAILMGLVGITEGAIPFAAADPIRVIPSQMIGTAIGCVVASLLPTTNMVAWGGLIVLPAVTGWFGYVAAIIAGVVSTALIVTFFKKPAVEAQEKASEASSNDLELIFE